MTKRFKVQVALVIIIFSSLLVIFTKTAEAEPSASYQKSGKVYLREGVGKCEDWELKDNYGAVWDTCTGGSICTTATSGSSSKKEVGCFMPVTQSPEPPAASPVISEPDVPSCNPDWKVTCCDGKNDSLSCPSQSTFKNLNYEYWADEACQNHNGYGSCKSAASPVADQPAPVKECPITKDEYTQCGATYGLEDLPATNLYHITRYTDCRGTIAKPYEIVDLGDVGQCKKETNASPRKIVSLDSTVSYRVASSYAALQAAQWQSYAQGGSVVSVPSAIFSLDPVITKQSIYVQFLDNSNPPKIIKFSNGNDFAVEYIDLNKGQGGEGLVEIETTPTVEGSNKIWGANLIRVDLSGFQEVNKTRAEVYFRNPVGVCDVNTCGFDGWTKIKSFGTNGFDQFSWTPKPGDVEPGIHMFGIFAVNAQGVADKILSVSPTNYISK